jgi:hypothetical protein
MPTFYEPEYKRLPVKVYRGWYGFNAQSKISASARRKGFSAIFPDCKSF